MAYKDRDVGRQRDRERFRRRTAERRTKGLCPRCGLTPPAPGHSLCDPCAEKQRVAGCARDARLRVAGELRRDPVKARSYERERDRRQARKRREAGLCIRCGKQPAAPEHAGYEPCIEKHREADRARYEAGKAPHASIATVQRGCCAATKSNSFARLTFLRNATDPSARAPCS